MPLLQRQTQPHDLPRCADLLPQELLGDHNQNLAGRLEMWTGLIETCSANSVVIENTDKKPYEIVGFGLSIFVTDEFVREAQENPKPYLALDLLLRWQSGRFPGLGLADIREANKKTGLNLVGLHTVWGKPGMSDEECAPIRDLMLDSLFAHHRGYNIKAFTKEAFGEEERQRYLTFGFLERNDYSGLPEITAEKRPYLMGISKEEAFDPSREGRLIRDFFRYTPPACAFTPADQETLQLALIGQTETDIAATLNISKESVKSRWDSIYSHVPRSLEAALFRQGEEKLKSRVLLQWLRNHPEELRPSLFFPGINLVGEQHLPPR